MIIILIKSCSITSVGFIDNKIWDLVIAALSNISYYIVGLSYKSGLIKGEKVGSNAYSIIFIIGIIFTYTLIAKIHMWIMSWPMFVKILVPCIFIVLLFIVIILAIVDYLKHNKY